MATLPTRTARRGLWFLILAAVAFGALLLWSTLASQQVECTVTLTYAGAQGTGRASAASEADALREAQTAACGPLTRGMNDRIACGRTPPAAARCRKL